MKGIGEGLSYLLFFLGIAVMFHGCTADNKRPVVGPDGWLYSTQDSNAKR